MRRSMPPMCAAILRHNCCPFSRELSVAGGADLGFSHLLILGSPRDRLTGSVRSCMGTQHSYDSGETMIVNRCHPGLPRPPAEDFQRPEPAPRR